MSNIMSNHQQNQIIQINQQPNYVIRLKSS